MRKRERLSGPRKIIATLAVVAVTGLVAAALSWSGRADNGADHRRADAPGLFADALAPGLQHANPMALRHRPVTVDVEALDEKWILRSDAMHGWRMEDENLAGLRFEIRRKF